MTGKVKKESFTEKVLFVVRDIPKGKTLSYKEVAILAGSPGAARAVGNIMARNHNPEIPCHRVIKSNGETGGYNRGHDAKKKALEREKAGLDTI